MMDACCDLLCIIAVLIPAHNRKCCLSSSINCTGTNKRISTKLTGMLLYGGFTPEEKHGEDVKSTNLSKGPVMQKQ